MLLLVFHKHTQLTTILEDVLLIYHLKNMFLLWLKYVDNLFAGKISSQRQSMDILTDFFSVVLLLGSKKYFIRCSLSYKIPAGSNSKPGFNYSTLRSTIRVLNSSC